MAQEPEDGNPRRAPPLLSRNLTLGLGLFPGKMGAMVLVQLGSREMMPLKHSATCPPLVTHS